MSRSQIQGDAGAIGPHPAPRLRSGLAIDLVRLARPRQWSKNVFVITPLVFSESIAKSAAIPTAAAAFASFCLLSSCLYGLNDLIDAEADRSHPRKRTRPIASGRVSPAAALAWSAALLALAVLLSLAVLPRPLPFLALGGLYLANGLAYCLFLKHRVIVDILSISIGFVIRLLAGCSAIGVEASSWILVCGFSLAMLLGFGKRRLEVGMLDDLEGFRPSLRSYSVEKLNMLLSITSSVCLLAYMLYTVSPQTVEIHRTDRLVFTVPFVAYGIFRYLFKVQEGRHDGPDDVLLKDYVFLVNSLLWLLAVVVVLYGPGSVGRITR